MSALSKLSTLKQLGPVLTRQNILALQTNYVHRRAVFYLINHTCRYYPVRSFETSAQTDAQGNKPASPGSSATSTATTGPNPTLPQQQQLQPKDPKESKEPLLKRIKHEINHYVNGTKLLGYEIKVSTKLLIKFAQGYELTRREHNQLKRTMGDVFRLVPFSAFVIIPFAELLLPVALKIFPNLLPSTYESGKDKHLKRMKLMEIRRKTSEIIHETLEESSLLSYNSIESAEKKKAFLKFFQKVYTARQMATSGETAGETNTTDDKIVTFTHSEIQNIAKMFKNDTVLDNLSRSQLIAMSKFMSLRPFGTDNMLRQQIRFLLKGIMNDDKVIFYEGVDSLSQEELYQACVSRGMKSYGLTTEELKDNMKIWLQLRLKDRIPSVLMILSSTVTYGGLEDSSKWMQDMHMRVVGNSNSDGNGNGNNQYERMLDLYYNGILHVLSTIPDPVYNIAKLDVSASAPESSTPSSSSKVETKSETESKAAAELKPEPAKALEAEVAPQTVVSTAAAPATIKVKVDSMGTARVGPTVTDSRVQQTVTTTTVHSAETATATKQQPVEKEKETKETAVTEEEKEKEGEEEEAILEESKIDENAFKLKALKEQEELIKKEKEEEAMRTKLAEMPVSDIISLDKDDTPTVLAKAEAEAEAALRAAEEEQERAKEQATEAGPKDKEKH